MRIIPEETEHSIPVNGRMTAGLSPYTVLPVFLERLETEYFAFTRLQHGRGTRDDLGRGVAHSDTDCFSHPVTSSFSRNGHL